MKFTSVSSLFVAIQKHLNIASIHMEKAVEYADDAPTAPATDRPSKRNRDYDKGDDQPNKTPKLTLKPPSNGGEGPVPEPEGSGPQCRKCGVRNHSPKDCKIAASGHPDINTTDNEWRDSAAGLKAWRDYGIRHLKRFKRIDGSAWNDNRDSGGKPKFLLKGAEKKQDRRNHFNKQSKSPLVHDSVACMSGGDASKDADMAYLEHLLAINNNSGIQHHTIPCEIVVNNLISLNANALIDTGALQSNYVDLKTAAAIVKAQMAAQELEERMHVASHVHTYTSCSSGSALSVLECLGCKNKVFKNNEDFLFDQPGGIDNTTKHKHKHKLRFGQVPGKTLPHTMEQETGTVSTEPLSTQPAKANSTSTDIQSLPATSAKTIITTNSNSRICTGVKGMCTDSKGVVNNFGFKYRNEANNTLEILEHLQAKILDIPYDIIIGRPTIVEHQLLHKLSTHFSEENVASGGAPTRSSNHSAHDVTAAFGQPTVPEDHPALNVLYKKDELLTPEYDDDGIELKVKDFPWEKEDTPITQNGNENAPKPQPTIHGSPELQARIRSLLAEFDDIFSTDLKPQPAMVPPMDVKVDKTQWHKPRNRLLPRTQTHEKNAEIERQIRKMVAAKVIKPSQASHYS